MILLDDTDKLLEIVLAGAHATTAPPFTSSYVDVNQSTFAVSAMGELDGVANGSTDVTVVAAPGATTTRKIQHLSVYNVDTAAVVLTVQLDHGGTNRIVWKGTLAVGDTLIYVDTLGFKVTDANGQVKTGPTVVSLTSGVTGILPAANGGTGVTNAAGSTITLGGSLAFTGAFTTSIAVSGNTSVTLPTSGTLVNTAITTLSSLVSIGTITTGVWNAGAVTSSGIITGTSLKITADEGPAAGIIRKTASNQMAFQAAGVGGFRWNDSGNTADIMTLSDAGVLTVNGFGTHAFSSSGAGVNAVSIGNTAAGTGNQAQLYLHTDTAYTGILAATASNFTASGDRQQAGVYLEAQTAGGLSLAAIHASGTIRFYSGGTTLRATLQTAGTWTWAPYGVGTITSDASGNLTSVSDIRYKDRISLLPYGLAEVLQLHPIQHGYNELSRLERDHLYGGFIAQDVQKVIPLAVGQMVDGYLTLSDRPILGAVVNAIKTHETRLRTLEERIH